MRSTHFYRYFQRLHVALHHFVLQSVPDLAMELDEPRRQTNLRDIARAWKIDRVLADRVRLRARRKHDDAVGKRDSLLEIVRDEDDGLAIRRPEIQKLVFHELPSLHVERGKRLVHEQDLRIHDERLRERDALLHAARELMRIAMAMAAQPDAVEPHTRLGMRFALRHAAIAQPDRYIVERVQPRHERIGLEKIAGLPIEPDESLAEHVHAPG